jgi:acyl carrier protein
MLERSGSAFGGPLQSIRHWWPGPDRAVASLELPRACAHEASRYPLHPSLIDATLQVAGLQRCSVDVTPCQPIAIGRVDLYPVAGEANWAIASRNPDDGERHDVSLVDDDGAARLTLTGLQLAPVAADSRAAGVVNDWLYRLEWKEAPGAGVPIAVTPPGTWLIAGAADALTSQLSARLAANGYGVRDAHGELEPAIAAAANDPGGCAGIIFVALTPTGPSGSSSVPARAALELGTRLSRHDGADRPRVWFVTRGSQPVLTNERVSCEHAALWGIGRTLAEEHPAIWGGLIDLDPAAPPAAAAGQVVDTVRGATAANEDQVAFRSGRRYALRLVRSAAGPNQGIGLRPNATYVIAGGLGALGLKVAHWMVDRGARRLLLLGRTPLPARRDWDKPHADRDRERIAALRNMEALGASVHAGAVDITDLDQLRAAVARVAADGWPPIAGIVQCAGVLQGRLVGDGDEQDFEDVWRPKAQGTLNLDELTAGSALDFFVVFSSMASFLPSAGQASYAAANCFLDAFAADARAIGKPVVAINWGPWADAGMAAALSKRGALGVSSRGFDSLTAGQALSALSRVLAAPAFAQTAVMAFNWRQWRRADAVMPLFADLAASDAAAPAAATRAGEPALDLRSHVAAAATGLERRALVEGLLRDEVAQVLKRPAATIELMKPFRAMGLDSLMALELRNRLEGLAAVRLPATLAWNYPTIAALAPFVASKAGIDFTDAAPVAVAGPLDDSAADLERMLAEIEQLSDADARRLTVEEK